LLLLPSVYIFFPPVCSSVYPFLSVYTVLLSLPPVRLPCCVYPRLPCVPLMMEYLPLVDASAPTQPTSLTVSRVADCGSGWWMSACILTSPSGFFTTLNPTVAVCQPVPNLAPHVVSASGEAGVTEANNIANSRSRQAWPPCTPKLLHPRSITWPMAAVR
jgi:hypothetical protein